MALSAGTKRAVACLLVGLGTLGIVGAIMLPLYTVSKIAKVPLDLESTTIAENRPGEPSEVLDAKSLAAPKGTVKIDQNVPLVQQRFLTVEDPSDAHQATLQAGNSLRRTDRQGDTGLLDAYIDRVTIDRVTGQPVGSNPNGSIASNVTRSGQSVAEPVDRHGLQYQFPFGTKQQNYPYFDTTARMTSDMQYRDQGDINGTRVFHFEQDVPATNLWQVSKSPLNQLTMTASKWGIKSADPDDVITMPRWYTNKRELWVEPQSGTIIKSSEVMQVYYARSGDKPEVTALRTHLVSDDKTVESQRAAASQITDKLSLVKRIIPIVLALLGIAALVGGILLGLRGGPPSGKQPATPDGTPDSDPDRGGHDMDAPTEQFSALRNPDAAPTQQLSAVPKSTPTTQFRPPGTPADNTPTQQFPKFRP